MRAPWLAVLALTLPLAGALPETDTREILANHAHPTDCPTYATPATIACFEAPANATRVRIDATPDLGDAQPRMIAWAYNGTHLLGTRWMCDDGDLAHEGMTLLVVALQTDRDGCGDARLPLIAHGRLTAAWS